MGSEAPAEDPVPPAEQAGKTRPEADAERRQSDRDVCGPGRLDGAFGGAGPEDLRDVMRATQDAVAGAVTRYGGYVAKYLGDGVLAYFGWPQAHEDQAERAVRAGLDAVVAVGTLTLDGGMELQARAGIATGHVVVGDLVGEAGRDAEAVSGEDAEPGGTAAGDCRRGTGRDRVRDPAPDRRGVRA